MDLGRLTPGGCTDTLATEVPLPESRSRARRDVRAVRDPVADVLVSRRQREGVRAVAAVGRRREGSDEGAAGAGVVDGDPPAARVPQAQSQRPPRPRTE